MGENIDDDMFKKQHFPSAHTEQKKGVVANLVAVIASSTPAFEGRRRQQTSGPRKFLQIGRGQQRYFKM